jgi:signal transduction histidine kinase
VDAALLAAELRDLALPLARERGVELAAAGSGRLLADRHALRRAALNLIRNAVEASPTGSAVEVTIRAEDAHGVLEVSDRGGGVPPDSRARRFEPFFTTKERGTGLGLALAHKAAVAHGGTLALDGRPGGGTVARLSIPAQDGPAPRRTVPA